MTSELRIKKKEKKMKRERESGRGVKYRGLGIIFLLFSLIVNSLVNGYPQFLALYRELRKRTHNFIYGIYSCI